MPGAVASVSGVALVQIDTADSHPQQTASPHISPAHAAQNVPQIDEPPPPPPVRAGG
jgi:hypothetical protein